MSIATEITRIKTAKADIKSAIEEKGVEVGEGTIDTYAEKIGEISSGGGIDYLKYAKAYQFATMEGLPEEVVVNFENATTLQNLICNFNVTNVKKLTINCQKPITNMARMIYDGDKSFEHITINVDTSKCGTFNQCFNRMPNLKIIDGPPLDFSSSGTNGASMFYYSPSLEELRIAENSIKVSIGFGHCSLLSDTTIQSIIDGLADLTGGTQQTLTLHSTVGVKLTEEQKATITAKNWELVY